MEGKGWNLGFGYLRGGGCGVEFVCMCVIMCGVLGFIGEYVGGSSFRVW